MTWYVAVIPLPSLAVAVTVTVTEPVVGSETTVSRPALTEMSVLLLLQVTVWVVAFEGDTVRESCKVSPARPALLSVQRELVAVPNVGVPAVIVMDATGKVTVMFAVEVKLPSEVVALIAAVPAATPVTRPEVLTVATPEALVDHVRA